MDLYCPQCGEPTDNDYLHDLVESGIFDNYHAALHAFQSKGCVALGDLHSPNANIGRAMAMDAMFDLLGDDVDGAMSMMDDYSALFD